ncbi:MAG TPA: DNA gyrase C-terminal beta-propeller domain-containing protein, partial [Halanaerobiales bacterium]|nr:DNA gyrase C-terminal beta-propeller domain-containing protein [Halanaerobiales bacterium]
LSEYRLQSRGGKGLITARITEKNGNLAGIKVVNDEHELVIITGEGIIIRTPVAQISRVGRNTLGVKVIRIKEGDQVVSLARINPGDDTEETEEIESEDIGKTPINESREKSAENDNDL